MTRCNFVDVVGCLVIVAPPVGQAGFVGVDLEHNGAAAITVSVGAGCQSESRRSHRVDSDRHGGRFTTACATDGGDTGIAIASVAGFGAAIRSGECRIASDGLGFAKIIAAIEQTAGRIVGSRSRGIDIAAAAAGTRVGCRGAAAVPAAATAIGVARC